MDLRELRYFVQVAELKSFSKAAIHLRIAQPALSRQVRKLEDELGAELIIRSARGLELTDAGAHLLRRAYTILNEAEDLKSSIRARGNPVSGTISLGVPPAAGEMLVAPAIARAEESYPELRINVVEGFSGFLYEQLLNHELSLALMHNPVPHRELHILPLLVEDMYLVGPARPTRGIAPASEVTEIRDLPLVLPSRPHSLRLLVETTLAEHDIPMNLKLQTDGLTILRAVVRAGLGYTVLTYGSVYRDVMAGELSARRLVQPPITWTLCLVKRAEPHRARAVDAFTDILRTEVHRLVDSGIWRGNPQYSPEESAHAIEGEAS